MYHKLYRYKYQKGWILETKESRVEVRPGRIPCENGPEMDTDILLWICFIALVNPCFLFIFSILYILFLLGGRNMYRWRINGSYRRR